MMDTNILKIYCGMKITESEKFKNSTKLSLLNFVENATIHQLMSMVLDGRIIKDPDVQEKQILEDRFIAENYQEVIEATWAKTKTYLSTAGALGTNVSGVWAIYRMIRAKFDKCTKQCGKFEINSVRRQYCMAKCKKDRYAAELEAAKKAKDPKKIEKAQKQLMKAEKKVKDYEKHAKKRGTKY